MAFELLHCSPVAAATLVVLANTPSWFPVSPLCRVMAALAWGYSSSPLSPSRPQSSEAAEGSRRRVESRLNQT